MPDRRIATGLGYGPRGRAFEPSGEVSEEGQEPDDDDDGSHVIPIDIDASGKAPAAGGSVDISLLTIPGGRIYELRWLSVGAPDPTGPAVVGFAYLYAGERFIDWAGGAKSGSGSLPDRGYWSAGTLTIQGPAEIEFRCRGLGANQELAVHGLAFDVTEL